MTTPVVIVGAGGHAREILDVFDACNAQSPGAWDVLGFISEISSDHGQDVQGKRCLGGVDWFAGRDDCDEIRVVCGIGDPAVRRRLAQRCTERGLRFASVVHPRSVVTPHVTIGTGVVIAAGFRLGDGRLDLAQLAVAIHDVIDR